VPPNLFIHPDVKTVMAVHAGDTVMIDFFVDCKRLCSGKAIWHNMVIPPTQPGQAKPTYMVPAQFVVPNCIWTNVTEGNHVLKVRASDFHSLSAISAPVHITVLPPLPVEPPKGTHIISGRSFPALRPEQVQLSKTRPPVAYATIGTVSAQTTGQWPRDSKEAFDELKIQAAQMGANWVIIDRISQSKGTMFSDKMTAFAEPEIYLSGRAIYVPPRTPQQ